MKGSASFYGRQEAEEKESKLAEAAKQEEEQLADFELLSIEVGKGLAGGVH